MGLGRWLLYKLAGALGVLPHQYVRRYRITLFGETLGTFTLPIGDHMTNPQALLRPVVTKPFRIDFGEDSYYYWVEPNQKDGGFKTVEWHPPTPELRAEVDRFYQTAHGLNSDFTVNPALQPPLATRTVEETRFIRAVLANREAEQPYLDYAAWLSAKGDGYGDYIRLALEIGKLPEGDKARERLEKRRAKIVEKHGPRWVLPLANIGLYPGVYISGIDGYYPDVWFNAKGVIEEMDVPSDSLVFPAHGSRLFYGAPFLRKLSVNQLNTTVADFASIPQMAQIESLSLSIGRGTPNDFQRFAASPHLTGLRELKLSGYQFGPEAAAHLANAAWMANVHTLDIAANSIGDDGAEAFAESPFVANLTVLELFGSNLTDRGLIALCCSPHLKKLTTLHIGSSPFTADGMHAVATSTFAPSLKSIKLDVCNLDDAALQALATGTFPALTALDVSYNVARDGLRALVEAPFFRNLEVFCASANECGDVVANAIASAGFVSLRELSLSGNQLSDAGAIALARSKAVTKLTKLELADNPFGLEGVKALAETDLPLLEELDLHRVPIGRPGAAALAESRHFKNLKRLIVSEEHVGLIGREMLLKRFTDQVMSFW